MGAVSAPFPSWNRSILTEIYLCHACSYQEIQAYEARAEWAMAAGAYTALATVRGSDPYAHNSKGRALSKLPVREQGGGGGAHAH